jgi:D-glycerate 3-kinase
MERLSERLAPVIAALVARSSRCPVVGLSGAQGTGKSTLARALEVALSRDFGLRAVVLALDDYYLPRARRIELAQRVHPLLLTRGVPGTHELDALCDALSRMRAGAPVELLAFSKALDDRLDERRAFEGRCEVVLFEGWCIGARPESDAELAPAQNELERAEDSDGRFRRSVNQQLAGPYAALWRTLDLWVFLEAPSMEAVHAFRAEQERALRAAAPSGAGVMADAQLRRFVEHFERISRRMLADAPNCADVVAALDPQRRLRELRFATAGARPRKE